MGARKIDQQPPYQVLVFQRIVGKKKARSIVREQDATWVNILITLELGLVSAQVLMVLAVATIVLPNVFIANFMINMIMEKATAMENANGIVLRFFGSLSTVSLS